MKIEDISTLEKTRDELQASLIASQRQLDDMKVDHAKTGKYSDSDVFLNLKYKIREDTTILHNINRQLKNLRKTNGLVAFKELAKKILDKDTFEKIERESISQ